MSHRDIERVREIETLDDVGALKRLRSARKGQITKVERDVEKYSGTLVTNKDCSGGYTENQLYFYDLIQYRILGILQLRRDDTDRVTFRDKDSLEDEEAVGDAELTTAQNLKLQLQEYIKAIEVANKARKVKLKLKAFADSDRMGDRDMEAKLQSLETLVDELLDAEAELTHINEVTTLIHDVHISYQAFTKDVLKAMPEKIVDTAPTTVKDHRSPYLPQFKLPKTDMPSFEGDPKLWRHFWEHFNQRISIFPDIPPSEKIAQLEQAIQPPDGRALICAPKGTEDEYQASVAALKQRYDQPKRIYRTYIHETFDHITPRTRKGLYELSTRLQDAMTALKLYGGMDAGSVMVAAAEKGLNKETMLEWSAYTSRKKLQPSMENFRAFITRKAEELDEEDLQYVKNTPAPPKASNYKQQQDPDPTPTTMEGELRRTRFSTQGN